MDKVKKEYKQPQIRMCATHSAPLMNPASPGQIDAVKEHHPYHDEVHNSSRNFWSIIFFFIAVTSISLALPSCSTDTEYVYIGYEQELRGTQTTVYLNMPELLIENSDSPTRGIQYIIDDHLHPYWSGDVTIGVFPVSPQVNSQVKYTFNVPDKDKSFSTQFVGVGWGLKANNTYAAYFPYRNLSSDLEYDSIPVYMTGQKQVGNNNLDNFEQYEYLYAKATMPQDSAVTFNFERKNAIIWLQLDIPCKNSWRRATITNINGDSVFVEEGYMNVSTGNITATKRSPSISVELSEIRSFTSDKINIFISVIPTRTGPLILSLEAADQDKTIYTELSDQELKPNVVTRFRRTPSPSQYLFVDLGLPSGTKWAKANLGAVLPYETGNYYSWANAYSHQDYFYWSSYTYCNFYDENGMWTNGNSMSHLYKYTIPDEFYEGSWYNTQREFIGDNIREIELDDDAAQQALGDSWRIPSAVQFQELIDNCVIEWTDSYNGTGISGYSFTGPNGNSIFLPASGWIGCENQRDVEQFIKDCHNQVPGKPHYVMEEYEDYYYVLRWFDAYGYNHSGYYWTRDLDTNYSFNALECKFTEIKVSGATFHSQPSITDVKRYVGCTIRPVLQ